ncbi:MAG: hypothetical protein JWO31_2528, partial [Phycisphaerales bacterium]|nr:hypothetical protein [Phycisphaerales bacterium]
AGHTEMGGKLIVLEQDEYAKRFEGKAPAAATASASLP